MAGVTRTRRHRWLALGLCVAIVAVAAIVPGGAALEVALFERSWVLLPDMARAPRAPERTEPPPPAAPVLASLPSRAPPAVLPA